MAFNGPNNPVVVWAVCYLWLLSMATVVCALTLFYCVDNMVAMLRLDIVLVMSLLSGLIMSPANMYMLYAISKGEKIDLYANVLCYPLWLCLTTVIMLNIAGCCLCAYKIHICRSTVSDTINLGMQYYRSNPKYKHFMDTIQWTIKCCGLESYTDWFSRDWYDKIRDYEWDPASNNQKVKDEALVSDSVPLSLFGLLASAASQQSTFTCYSCCKTGSCVSNYLMEMGTNSINPEGCANEVYKIILTALIIQLMMFASTVIAEILIMCYLRKEIKAKAREEINNYCVYDVKNILDVNPNFESSGSLESITDDSDDTDDSDSSKKCEGLTNK